jgi:broad specificity phosphatase PhoE
MPTRLVIVQHGEKDSTPGDPDLTATGRRQAAELAEALASWPITALYTSPLRRARSTAEPISRRLDLAADVDERLAERMNWDDGEESLEAFLAEWRRASAERDYVPRSGVSSRAAGHRLRRVLLELSSRHVDHSIAMVTHGGITVDLLRDLLGDDELERRAPGLIMDGPSPCAITEVLVEDPAIIVLAVAASAGLD